MINIYLSRHGETLYNQQGLMQGWCDSKLLESSIMNAKKTGEMLREEGISFDLVFHSDSGRVKDTLKYLLQGLGADLVGDIIEDKGLREMNFGSAEKCSVSQVWREVSEANNMEDVTKSIEAIERCDLLHKLPQYSDAESGKDFTLRVNKAMDNIVKKASDNNRSDILIVAHGLTILNILMRSINFVPSFRSYRNLSLSKMIFKEGVYTTDFTNRIYY